MSETIPYLVYLSVVDILHAQGYSDVKTFYAHDAFARLIKPGEISHNCEQEVYRKRPNGDCTIIGCVRTGIAAKIETHSIVELELPFRRGHITAFSRPRITPLQVYYDALTAERGLHTASAPLSQLTPG